MNYSNGTTPQAPPADMHGGYSEYLAYRQYELAFKKQAKKHLRRTGNFVGLGILLFIVFNNIIAVVNQLFFANTAHSGMVDNSFGIIGSFFYVGIPFFIVYLALRKREVNVTFVPLGKPKGKLIGLFIPIGFMLCLTANYLTAVLVTALSSVGIELTKSAATEPSGAAEIALMFLSTAVMPALMEEFALRGVVLQSFRQFGMTFAIVSSSCIFGMMHGNLIQAPFALIVGLTVSFIVIKTQSIWLGIIIHFLNNSLSVLGYAIDGYKYANWVIGAVIVAVFISGIICTIVLCVKDKTLFKKERGEVITAEGRILSGWEKFVCTFINVPMILSFIYMCFVTSQYVAVSF